MPLLQVRPWPWSRWSSKARGKQPRSLAAPLCLSLYPRLEAGLVAVAPAVPALGAAQPTPPRRTAAACCLACLACLASVRCCVPSARTAWDVAVLSPVSTPSHTHPAISTKNRPDQVFFLVTASFWTAAGTAKTCQSISFLLFHAVLSSSPIVRTPSLLSILPPSLPLPVSLVPLCLPAPPLQAAPLPI